MKPIILTEEHKAKLLDMCTALFPETIWFFWLDDTCGEMSETHLGYNQTIKLGDKTHPFKDGLMIHWFEFCMTHLAAKLLITYDFKLYKTTGNFMYEHPIDYLYTQFKKVKL